MTSGTGEENHPTQTMKQGIGHKETACEAIEKRRTHRRALSVAFNIACERPDATPAGSD